jgi:hypothetical protein
LTPVARFVLKHNGELDSELEQTYCLKMVVCLGWHVFVGTYNYLSSSSARFIICDLLLFGIFMMLRCLDR